MYFAIIILWKLKKNIEILAPAGNIESFKTAIFNGANAVYLGLDDFNARANIENFTLDKLVDIVNFAHLFNVKIYLTLNILFQDFEFEKVYQIVKKSLQANVDAFIIQDIGLAYFLLQKFPKIELHASTQMGFNNLEGVLFAEKVGFKRVVLARETPLEEIKRIHKNCSIELEYFVQGALCVSYSGNCYLCSLLANSSGNRGKCKQFCRLPFNMQLQEKNIKENQYLLSTKDFCMVEKLKELTDAGIVSLKIEGRARRPAYVGQAVSTYKKIIENNFKYNENDVINLKKVFNRGEFIPGYFENKNIIYDKVQNHIGIEIGKVENVINGKKFNEVIINSKYKLCKDDVIKFFVNDKEKSIITIKDIKQSGINQYRITTTNSIPKYSIVRLIVDSQNEKNILETKKQLNVNGYFFAEKNKKAKLVLQCNNCKIEIESDFELQPAKSSPLTFEETKKQLSKLGEIFKLENLQCEIQDVFIAKSALNELRRKGLEKLKNEILNLYNKENNLYEKQFENKEIISLINQNQSHKQAILIHSFENFDKIKNNYDLYVYSPYEINAEKIKMIYEKYNNFQVFLSFPLIVNEKEKEIIKDILNTCKNWGIYANNYYALSLTQPNKILIASTMNVCNSYSTKFYANLGIAKIVLSIENFDYKNLKNNNTTLFKFTKFLPEYMYLKHCPFKEHFNSNCSKCLYKDGISYNLYKNKLLLKRIKFLQCIFILKSSNVQIVENKENFSTIEELI